MQGFVQDGFGNYCLQYVLELGQVHTNASIIGKLLGHFPDLSQQKFSSNVVEKCLKLRATELQEVQDRIVRELIISPLLPRLLQVGLSAVLLLVESCISDIGPDNLLLKSRAS